jgi:H+/Cl- antiporter ClcA
MSGGACSGFAIATGAPLSGILFAIEEAHRRFSTTLLAVASISVLAGTVTHKWLASFFDINTTFFDLTISQVLPLKYLGAAMLIGIVCGLSSILLTNTYRVVKRIYKRKRIVLPFMVKIVLIFAVTALLGFFSAHFIGTGHALIEDILHGKVIWYMVLIAFAVRALLMIYANNGGITGGIFVPNLAFGAMIASVIADGLIALKLVEPQYYAILIVVGMASFFAAASRTPITAIVFAAEALCIASNIIPVVFGVTFAYITVELSGKISYTDTVIETRTEHAHHGKDPIIVNSYMKVQKGAFVDGMEIRDVLWPPTCVVLSVDRKQSHSTHYSGSEIREGDLLHLHYQTYDPDLTMDMLTSLLGEQTEEQPIQTHLGSDDHVVPLD